MPLTLPDKLPAIDILKQENIFVIDTTRAMHQDIRPMKIGLFNIMPVKVTTETHLLRLLSNTPLQIELDLLHPRTHDSKNTSTDHLQQFYKTFDQIKHQKYDGFIITGAPVEHLEFEDVNYWDELKEILDWCDTNVTSTLLICWASQAGLYHYYGVPKYHLPAKMFGVFDHTVNNKTLPIVRGFDDVFPAPHSRHTEVKRSDIEKIDALEIISESEEAGIYMVGSKDGKKIFVTGHSEYDPDTLKNEYVRDINKGLDIAVPKNYFPKDDPTKEPLVTWRSHANLLFTNWLNYYVYQVTPYDLGNNTGV